jgi:hypothetical protein
MEATLESYPFINLDVHEMDFKSNNYKGAAVSLNHIFRHRCQGRIRYVSVSARSSLCARDQQFLQTSKETNPATRRS